MKPIRFFTSLILFFLCGEFSFERDFINIKYPNTILGIIPVGSRRDVLPVSQIASVRSSFSMKFLKFVLGLIVIAGGAYFLMVEVILLPAVIMLTVGVEIILTSFEVFISIGLTSGQVRVISFWVFEQNKADEVVKNIHSLIVRRMDDTSLSGRI